MFGSAEKIIEKLNINPKKVVIDHVRSKEILRLVLAKGYFVGITISKSKSSVAEALELIEIAKKLNKTDKVMINSDIIKNDPLEYVPFLYINKHIKNNNIIEKNAKTFFKIKDIFSYTWDSHDMPMTPHLIHVAFDACMKKHSFGYAFEAIHYFIKNNIGKWAFAEEDLDKTGKYLFKNPEKVLELSKRWKEKIKKYRQIVEKIVNLDKLSLKNLLDLYKDFYKAYTELYAIPILANPLDFYFGNWLRGKVKTQEDFIKLITPTKESFSQKELRELLSIKKDKNFQENIKKHAQKYHWLSNTYAQAKRLKKDLLTLI